MPFSSTRCRTLLLSGVAAVTFATGLAAQRGGGPPAPLGPPPELKFRYMGPAPAGRIAAAAGVPGDPTIYYLGAASGGVWKSTDSGATFLPVFDNQPVMAIGSLAVSSSDPSQVWAGTGEAWVIRDSDIMGDGIYKSTDAGATWKKFWCGAMGSEHRSVVQLPLSAMRPIVRTTRRRTSGCFD
jgi:hypothetical protein